MIFDMYSVSVFFIALSIDVILGLRMICQTRRLGSLRVQRLNCGSTLTQHLLILLHYFGSSDKHRVLPTTATRIVSPIKAASLHYRTVINGYLMVHDPVALNAAHQLRRPS